LFTVGVFDVEPGQQTIIPESVHFTIDLRARESAILSRLETRLGEFLSEEAPGLERDIQTIMREDEVAFDPQVLAAIEEALIESGRPWRRVMSGPGHDGQVMGRHVPSGMIFVASVDGRSHCPEEFSRPEDIEAGANALLGAMLRLAANQ
jgi:N-carbamoyl-L-amino-acid hydrolase